MPERIPADTPPVEAPTTFSPDKQNECLIFTRLPSEIRLQIFKHVLGEGHVYHIIERRARTGPRLAHLHFAHEPFASASYSLNPCSVDVDDDQEGLPLASIEISVIRNGHELRKHLYSRIRDISNANLALLRTCRQAYSEVRLLPYSHNTFRFSSVAVFVDFAHVIPPASLASLRRLHASLSICWPPEERPPNAAQSVNRNVPITLDLSHRCGMRLYNSRSDQSWQAFWALVGSKMRMPGLREMCLDLSISNCFPPPSLPLVCFNDYGLHISLEAQWLRPILGIRGLKEFEMRIVESSTPSKLQKDLLDEIRAIVCRPALE